MATARLTETWLSKQHLPGLYWDTKHKGLGLRINKTSRAWVFQKSGGKRETLGHYPELKLKDAVARFQIANLEHQTRPPPGTSPTLGQAMALKIKDMERNGRRPRSIAALEKSVRSYSSDWLDKPLGQITRRMLVERRDAIMDGIQARASQGNATGAASAKNWLAHVGSIWNHARELYERLPAWPRVKKPLVERRQEPIKDLPGFRRAFLDKATAQTRDIWLFALYSGLRLNDLVTMRWDHILPCRRRLHVPEPKGGPKRKFDLPLSRQMLAILDRQPRVCEWVWADNKGGKWVHRHGLRTTAMRDLPNPPSAHRCRDTFATIASTSVVNVPSATLKYLLNHKSQDVTDGYVDASDDAFAAMQAISDEIERRLGYPARPKTGYAIQLGYGEARP